MAKVLLLHTGGTLGMVGTPLVPDVYGSRLLEAVPELLQVADIDIHIVCNLDSSDLTVDGTQAAVNFVQGNADSQGGAIAGEKGSSLTVLDANFVDNQAGLGGGAIYFTGGISLQINDSSFSGKKLRVKKSSCVRQSAVSWVIAPATPLAWR